MVVCISGLATAGFAQGTVVSANTSTTLFRTNAFFIGGTSGNTANGSLSPRGFLYEVLTAPSTVTSVDPSLQGLLSGAWSDTGLTLTNTIFISGGRISGPSGINGQAANWPVGAFQSYVVVGWSANEGLSWAQLAGRLVGAQFMVNDGIHSYLQIDLAHGGVTGGFVGATTVQVGAAGPADGSAPLILFGSTPTVQGTPISTPTTLWFVTDPEPSTMSLVVFGMGMYGVFRRRK
jgi:hypothetical protein